MNGDINSDIGEQNG